MSEYRKMYIPGTLCKGIRRAAVASVHSADVCDGLYDFVMSRYADLVYMMRYGLIDVRCLM